jgi:hypothetical protein
MIRLSSGSCSTALINAVPRLCHRYLTSQSDTCRTGLLATGNYERLQIVGNTIESTGSGTGYITGTCGIDLNGPIALG